MVLLKAKIKLTYNLKDASGHESKIDDAINKMMHKIGAKWYAQGVETESRKRDICYDLELSIGD